eukprot:CAMPEP_0170076150 /NCGR_PEP_ID=MMETSP0019_2-20121128/13173_1 /TAXON_ID=98059 /ORGANISM="Dinobryon sp., Strain UTEXLB2267" /LENGTH=280 /DNA_ID=CAMNT_0010287603 /DNA_START=175 /DNA_END=1017 /DNA_ORIENTATION=+
MCDISAWEVLNLAIEQIKIRAAKSKRTRPSTTIAFAQTLDGSIAPRERCRLDISSKCSFRLLHSLRANHDAVLIGANTLAIDSPRLNVREQLPQRFQFGEPSQPRPVVVDSNLRCVDIEAIRLERPIFFSSYLSKSISWCDSERESKLQRWTTAEARIRSLGGDLRSCGLDAEGRCDLKECFELLASQYGIRTLLVEGGAGILQSCLELGLADQAVVTVRPCFLGGYNSMTRQLVRPLPLQQVVAASVGGDVVLIGQLNCDEVDEETQGRERVRFITADS